jgi:hypothetical protein|tara:strand:+ start:1390 stop:2175 length:786 start_codon:yes stop_codon:yes gene_type:complete
MDIIDTATYPIDQPDSPAYHALVAQCRADLADNGLFNLPGFLHPEALRETLERVNPVIATEAFVHRRTHNIYFKKIILGLAPDHPALQLRQTANHTICADQIEGSAITQLYDWPAFASFLADVMQKSALFPMDDRIAGANVMTYYDGEALNWHFDRSEFTTTLLLQTPSAGGAFEYLRDLRSEEDPNYDGVAALLNGELDTTLCPQDAGTLNVFRGVNTAHRVTPVEGEIPRINAVLTYFDAPGRKFSAEEHLGFYGRTTP